MKLVYRRCQAGLGALFLSLLSAHPAAAAPDYLRYYSTGLTAADSGDWEQVDKMMQRAIALKPEEKHRRVVRRSGYFPHYYLGLARYHLRDCPGALAAWAESEGQGAIIGRDEYADLLRRQSDCQKDGKPSISSQSTVPEAKPEETKKTGKEKVRTGQHLVEKSADPTRKGLGAVERLAPEGSELGKVANQGQKAVDVAEAATDIIDVVLSPSEKLEAAINAYFSGNPGRTLAMLQGIDISDPRAKAQVCLFRAAANFRLHLLAGRDPEHLEAARKNADLFEQEQWRKDFPAELFDPRFVRFLRGGG